MLVLHFNSFTKLRLIPCAVFTLEPLAHDPRNEVMDLRRVNQFTPLPLSCSALPGT